MTLIPFPLQPKRAIIVEPFNSNRTHWQASYSGDQWTNSLEFRPVLPLRQLVSELRQWPGRHGLPIKIVDTLDSEVAA